MLWCGGLQRGGKVLGSQFWGRRGLCLAQRVLSLGSYVAEGSGLRSDRLRAQIRHSDSAEALGLGRAIVEAKVQKQIVILQRFGRRDHGELVRDAISSMRRVLMLLPDCQTTPEAMGIEGAAAAVYFPVLGALMPEGLKFQHRSRQPPLDVANSALSFLYTVMLGECVTALYAAGLDPGIGVLHTDDERRPSLALDLLEEFRPMVVEQVVVSSARLGALKASHSRVEEGRSGVMLTKGGREALLEAYERRMLTRTRGAIPDFGGTIRRHLYRQAQRLQASISDPSVQWTGMSWR